MDSLDLLANAPEVTDPPASGPPGGAPADGRRARQLRLIVLWFCGLLGLLVAGYVFRAPLLRAAANAWIINDALAKADAVVVLGGGLETRPFEAARLYHQGLVPKILIMNPKPSPRAKIGLTPLEKDLTRQVLVKLNVPEADMVVVGTNVTSTYDESIAVRQWAEKNGARRVIVPTDLFHTRRVRWLFRKELKGTGAHVLVDAVPDVAYSTDDWWHREEGVVAFQNEVIKYLYYRIKY